MLASVSPASYRAMISGQSDCGIFPRLLGFSIRKDLGITFLRCRKSNWPAHLPSSLAIADPIPKTSIREIVLERRQRYRPAVRRNLYGSAKSIPLCPGDDNGKQENSEAIYWFRAALF